MPIDPDIIRIQLGVSWPDDDVMEHLAAIPGAVVSECGEYLWLSEFVKMQDPHGLSLSKPAHRGIVKRMMECQSIFPVTDTIACASKLFELYTTGMSKPAKERNQYYRDTIAMPLQWDMGREKGTRDREGVKEGDRAYSTTVTDEYDDPFA